MLRRSIKEFQKARVHTFAKYQSSGLRTRKWNALNHLADNIENVDYIEVLHGRIYESAHKKFKALCSLTSKRHSEALQETIQLHNKRDHIHDISDGQLAVRNEKLRRKRAVEIDS